MIVTAAVVFVGGYVRTIVVVVFVASAAVVCNVHSNFVADNVRAVGRFLAVAWFPDAKADTADGADLIAAAAGFLSLKHPKKTLVPLLNYYAH